MGCALEDRGLTELWYAVLQNNGNVLAAGGHLTASEDRWSVGTCPLQRLLDTNPKRREFITGYIRKMLPPRTMNKTMGTSIALGSKLFTVNTFSRPTNGQAVRYLKSLLAVPDTDVHLQ
jgi:hypothetical protein